MNKKQIVLNVRMVIFYLHYLNNVKNVERNVLLVKITIFVKFVKDKIEILRMGLVIVWKDFLNKILFLNVSLV
jgi:hypothetical protein